jgi:hypothetical protein
MNAAHNPIGRLQTARAFFVRYHKSHPAALTDLNKTPTTDADVGSTDNQQNSSIP